MNTYMPYRTGVCVCVFVWEGGGTRCRVRTYSSTSCVYTVVTTSYGNIN